MDVANEIAKRLGVEVEFVTPDWDLITAGNWGDQWDMSVGSMTVTTARQEILDFASPLITIRRPSSRQWMAPGSRRWRT